MRLIRLKRLIKTNKTYKIYKTYKTYKTYKNPNPPTPLPLWPLGHKAQGYYLGSHPFLYFSIHPTGSYINTLLSTLMHNLAPKYICMHNRYV